MFFFTLIPPTPLYISSLRMIYTGYVGKNLEIVPKPRPTLIMFPSSSSFPFPRKSFFISLAFFVLRFFSLVVVANVAVERFWGKSSLWFNSAISLSAIRLIILRKIYTKPYNSHEINNMSGWFENIFDMFRQNWWYDCITISALMLTHNFPLICSSLFS